MNDQEIRIAIAEACGFGDYNTRMNGWEDQEISLLPDYPNDLNAMYKAVEFLYNKHDGSYESYTCNLASVLFGTTWEIDIEDYSNLAILVNADCYIRAEAFLRTLGKWKD